MAILSFPLGGIFYVLGFIGMSLFSGLDSDMIPQHPRLYLALHFGGITAFYGMPLYFLCTAWVGLPDARLQILGGFLMLIGSAIWGSSLCYLSDRRHRLRTGLMSAGLLMVSIGFCQALGWGAIINGIEP